MHSALNVASHRVVEKLSTNATAESSSQSSNACHSFGSIECVHESERLEPLKFRVNERFQETESFSAYLSIDDDCFHRSYNVSIQSPSRSRPPPNVQKKQIPLLFSPLIQNNAKRLNTKEKLVTHEERWDFQSSLAGKHQQGRNSLDVSCRFFTPDSLRFGVPPKTASILTDFSFNGDFLGKHELPSFLDMFGKLFPNLKHLTLKKRHDCTEKSAGSFYPKDNYEGLYFAIDEKMEVFNETWEEGKDTKATVDKALLEKVDGYLRRAQEEASRMQRLYVLYRLPGLITINGVEVTDQERKLASPSTPTGCKVNREDWLTHAMAKNKDGGEKKSIQYFCSDEDCDNGDTDDESYEIHLDSDVDVIKCHSTPDSSTLDRKCPELIVESTFKLQQIKKDAIVAKGESLPSPNSLLGETLQKTETSSEIQKDILVEKNPNSTSAIPQPTNVIPKGFGLFPHTGRAISTRPESSTQETVNHVTASDDMNCLSTCANIDGSVSYPEKTASKSIEKSFTERSSPKKKAPAKKLSSSNDSSKTSLPTADKGLDSFLAKDKKSLADPETRAQIALTEMTDIAISGHLLSKCFPNSIDKSKVENKTPGLLSSTEMKDGIPSRLKNDAKEEILSPGEKDKNSVKSHKESRRKGKKKKSDSSDSKDSLNEVPSMVKVRLKKGKKKGNLRPPPSPASIMRKFSYPRQKKQNKRRFISPFLKRRKDTTPDMMNSVMDELEDDDDSTEMDDDSELDQCSKEVLVCGSPPKVT